MTRENVSSTRHPLRPILASAAAVAVTLLACDIFAKTSTSSFDDANRSFSEGHYADAAADFESIAHTRGWSAPLLYDLGNAYAQEGKVGRSVLSYERARILAPRDRDIAANLAYVRARAGLPTPVQPWYEVAARWLSPTAWTWLAAAAWWLVAGGLVAIRSWHVRRLRSAVVLAALLGAVGIAGAAIETRALDRAVVVAGKSAPVQVSPFTGAASETSLPEGDEVAIVGRHGDFLRVRDGHGHTGWVESSAVQAIAPRPS